MEFPQCPKCKKQVLLPLSDYAEGGASVRWKAWVCADMKCGFTVRIDKGIVTYRIIS